VRKTIITQLGLLEGVPALKRLVRLIPVVTEERDCDKRTKGCVDGDDHHGAQVEMSAPKNIAAGPLPPTGTRSGESARWSAPLPLGDCTQYQSSASHDDLKIWLDSFLESTFGRFMRSPPHFHHITRSDLDAELIFLAFDSAEDTGYELWVRQSWAQI
jgi:hypothetical protein